MTPRPYRLSIDFGTSNTVAALEGPDGRVRTLLFDGSPLLASAVFAGTGTDTRLRVGADAVHSAAGYPAGLEPNPKRRIDDGTVWLGERELAVVDLVAAVLDRVRDEAVRVAGRLPDDVVLTRPAAWGSVRVGTLASAARQAGLGPHLQFVAEPVAAAAYFVTVLERAGSSGKCIVVYDLGAGTFDVSVLRPAREGFEVLAYDGLPDVGGLDLDAAVVRHARTLTAGATDAWQRLDWPQSPPDEQARRALWQAARALKEQLSRHSVGEVYVPLVDRRVRLTREEFENLARVHLDRTAKLTLNLLRTTGVAAEEVAGVFLVGGASRIPMAATLLHRTLRIAPTVIDQPELVVAEGALRTGQLLPSGVQAGNPGVGRRVVDSPPEATPAGPPPDTSPPEATDPGPDEGDEPPPVRPPNRVPVASTTSIAEAGRGTDPPAARLGRRYALAGAAAAAVVIAVVLANTYPWGSSGGGSPDSPVVAASTGPSNGGSSPAGSAPSSLRGAESVGQPLAGHTSGVSDVAFSPDGRLLATGSGDGTVRFWNVATGQTVGPPVTAHTASVSLAFAPDGRTLATGGDATVRLWDVASRRPIGEPLRGHALSVDAVAFSPDGKLLASASSDRTVRLWDPGTRQPVGQPLTGHTDYVYSVAFTPDGQVLASAGRDRTVRLWDVASRQSLGQPITLDSGGVVFSLTFSPDGAAIVTGSPGVVPRWWDVRTRGSLSLPLSGDTHAVAFSPTGRALASGGRETSILLWDAATRQPVGQPLIGHTDQINAVAFSPDGKTFASASSDKTVRLWKLLD